MRIRPIYASMAAMERKTNKATSWGGVKAKLADFDHAGLIGLVRDLYTASKDNKAFLHARFGLGEDVLSPYKAVMDRWLWPDLYKRQDASVARAKKAVSDYKKAVGQPEGLAELEVYYCERAAGFSDAVALQDDSYFDALVRMFERALKTIAGLPDAERPPLWTRLDTVRRISHNFGYGVGDYMDGLLIKSGVVKDPPVRRRPNRIRGHRAGTFNMVE